MSQRLTRREIKQKDQFVTSVEHTLDYGRSHLKPILTGVVAVVAVALLSVLVVIWLRHRAEQASEALHAAVETLSAPVTGLQEEGLEQTFETEESRLAKAKELLEGVQEQYGSSSSGKLASLYLAKIAADEGDLDRAKELWADYSDGAGKSLVAAQVELNLLALERQQNGAEAVVDKLQGLLDSEGTGLPEDVLLYELASALEELSRGEEALTYYQRIVDEFPSSAYTPEARQKTAQLAAETSSAG